MNINLDIRGYLNNITSHLLLNKKNLKLKLKLLSYGCLTIKLFSNV
jgi:hypothetical protein